MITTCLVLAAVGGLIGWVTNYLAVKMIFRPREPIGLFGLRLQGLVPKRRREIAHKIAETVEKELVSHADIRSALADPEYQARFLQALEARLGGYLSNHLGDLSPLLSAFLPSDLLSRVRTAILSEVTRQFPNLIEAMVDHLEKKLDLRKVVVDRIEGFELDKLEEIVLRISSRELKHIEWLGGLLGFLIGLAQGVALYLLRR